MIKGPNTTDYHGEATEPPMTGTFGSGFINATAPDLWQELGHILDDLIRPCPHTVNTHLVAELDDMSERTQTVVFHYSGTECDLPTKGTFRIQIQWAPVLVIEEEEGYLWEYVGTDKVDKDGILDLKAFKEEQGTDLSVWGKLSE